MQPAFTETIHPTAAAYEQVIGWRYSSTGVWSYEFYCGSNKLCTVSSLVIPSPPVGISGCGMTWESPFDKDSTIFSGQKRYIYDKVTREKVAVLTYMEHGRYTINGSVSVHCDGDGHRFYSDDGMIARLVRYRGEDIQPPDKAKLYHYDYEPYYEGSYRRDMSDALKLLIFSFPLLRFAR